jgi:Mg-chelatase subunit ChlI
MSDVFPFSAIVGQQRMRLALILNAVNPQIGGVLIRGERGSAKSTAARALAALLPPLPVVADCPFGCDPHEPRQQCDRCRERSVRGERLPVAERQTHFVNLPVSATEDRVVGTLDIEAAIRRGERRFEPGVLAAANRGVLYVDEVNLLDDHVVDLLLDAAAMGINRVEREGISFRHPARFVLVGSMNPEEGELRPQLLDRFAHCVDVSSLGSTSDRVAVMERALEYERDPEAFVSSWQDEERKLGETITRARALLGEVRYAHPELVTIGELVSGMRADGHRGDIVTLKTAVTLAALAGRRTLETADILSAAELALPHRLKERPLGDPEGRSASLAERLEEIRRTGAERPQPPPAADESAPPEEKKKRRTGY